jgi:hypothetical protein
MFYGYSLTDFHDFDDCPFRFFVRHHLDRKWDIDQSNSAIALGHILDQTIKRFHKEECYGTKSSKRLIKLINDSVADMRQQVEVAKKRDRHHFFESTVPFMTEEVIEQAIQVFTNYYVQRKGNIHRALGEVGFCEWSVNINGESFKLWGGPDAFEIGDDGVAEVVDYKSRQNVEKGKTYMDMDLMPKIYTLLAAKKLLGLGHKKARFIVRFWQDPLEESFCEEFNLTVMDGAEFLFRQKIERILNVTDFTPCFKEYCSACNSGLKDNFIEELKNKFGISIII